MELTKKNKAYIDGLPYEALLSRWRFSPVGDPWFQGETGKYWGERMGELRNQPGGNDKHVAASKSLGWS
jgi:hypothetical protein